MRNDDCDNLEDLASMRQAFATANLRSTDYLLADCLTESQAHSVVSLGIERPDVIAASCWRFQEHCSYDVVLLRRQFPLLFLPLIEELALEERFFVIYQGICRWYDSLASCPTMLPLLSRRCSCHFCLFGGSYFDRPAVLGVTPAPGLFDWGLSLARYQGGWQRDFHRHH
jgi:hypothetical protein